jgi:hypothetical protein
MHLNDRHRRPESGPYASDIQLLPVRNLDPGQQPISRKPLITVGSSSYEPYRAEVVGRETWQSKEGARVPRGWPTVPQRLSTRGPFYFIVAITDFLLTLSPFMFVGE